MMGLGRSVGRGVVDAGPSWRGNRAVRGARGSTLIEVLIALALMSIVLVAVFGGMLTTVNVSKSVSGSTAMDAALSGVIERIVAMPYVACDGHDGPSPATLTAAYGAWPDRFAPSGVHVEVIGVKFWSSTAFVDGCTGDGGAELLTIRVTSRSGEAQATGQVVIRDLDARPT